MKIDRRESRRFLALGGFEMIARFVSPYARFIKKRLKPNLSEYFRRLNDGIATEQLVVMISGSFLLKMDGSQ